MDVGTDAPILENQGISQDNFARDTFKAPIATLLESIEEDNEIMLHDLAQAYSLFNARIKSCTTLLLDATSETRPALQYLQLHADKIAICIQRDVGRVLEDYITSAEESNRDAAGTVWYPSVVTNNKFRYLRQLVEVSHGALGVASSLFAFRSLSLLFSVAHIGSILDCVLAVLLTPEIPTPEANKTRSLSFHALTALHIPPSLVRIKQKELVEALVAIVNSDTLVADNASLVADATKLLRNLLLEYPLVFLNHTLVLYPRIMALAVSQPPLVRLAAAGALAGYSNAVIVSYKTDPPGSASSTGYEKIRSQLRRETLAFVKDQEARRRHQNNNNVETVDLTLKSIIYAEIPLDADTKPGPHIGWAFTLLACLTILAGPATLSDTDILKLVLRAIPFGASNHRWLPHRSLHSFLWRCLVWAFSLTPYMSRPRSLQGVSDWRNALRLRSTEYIQQAHALGVGPCLIHALLGKDEQPFSPALADHLPRDRDVTRAIDVLKGLVGHPNNSFFSQGIEVFLRITSDIGGDISSSRRDRSTWDFTAPLPMDLLNGVLIDTELKDMKQVLQSSQPFDISSIRTLCNAEIEEHWAQLLNTWVLAARRVFSDSANTAGLQRHKSNILHIWQALLLAQVQLSPSYEHLTATPNHSAHTLGLVKDFLTWEVSCNTRVRSVKELWTVMCRVFSDRWIEDAAETLLVDVLRHGGLEQEDVRELCIALVFSGKPDALATIGSTNDSSLEARASELWYFVAPLWFSRTPVPEWQSTAAFLSVPLRFSPATNFNRRIWEDLFIRAAESAASAGRCTNALLEDITRSLSGLTADILLCLLSYVQFDDADNIPCTLLHLVDDYLRRYPAQHQDVYPAINIIDALSQSISTCSPFSILPILKALQAGICAWIAATSDLVSDDEYNQHIMGFYHNSLDVLRRVTNSAHALCEFQDYLCSPFENIRKDAAGPLAFKGYWDKISARTDFHDVELPEKIINTLCAMYDVYGGERPSYLPVDTQSQLEEHVVPDSQLSREEPSLEVWYRRRMPARQPQVAENSTVEGRPSEEISFPPRHVPAQEASTSVARTNPLQPDDAKDSKSSHASSLGKRDSPVDMNIMEGMDASVRHTRSMKRSRLAHGDDSDDSEKGKEYQSININLPATPQHRRPPRENGPESHFESQAQDSLPSPPLSVEVPLIPTPPQRWAEGKEARDDDSVDCVESSRLSERAAEVSAPPDEPIPSVQLHNTATSDRPPELQGDTGVGSSTLVRRTGESQYLRMLRATHEVMQRQLADSDVVAEEVLAAQELLRSMGGMVTDKLEGGIESRSRD